jgi:hypothetical protein
MVAILFRKFAAMLAPELGFVRQGREVGRRATTPSFRSASDFAAHALPARSAQPDLRLL